MALIKAKLVGKKELRQKLNAAKVRKGPSRSFSNEKGSVFEELKQVGNVLSCRVALKARSGSHTSIDIFRDVSKRRNYGLPLSFNHDA